MQLKPSERGGFLSISRSVRKRFEPNRFIIAPAKFVQLRETDHRYVI